MQLSYAVLPQGEIPSHWLRKGLERFPGVAHALAGGKGGPHNNLFELRRRGQRNIPDTRSPPGQLNALVSLHLLNL